MGAGPLRHFRQWNGTITSAPMEDTIAFTPGEEKPKPNINRMK
jgi:hypothetical protein